MSTQTAEARPYRRAASFFLAYLLLLTYSPALAHGGGGHGGGGGGHGGFSGGHAASFSHYSAPSFHYSAPSFHYSAPSFHSSGPSFHSSFVRPPETHYEHSGPPVSNESFTGFHFAHISPFSHFEHKQLPVMTPEHSNHLTGGTAAPPAVQTSRVHIWWPFGHFFGHPRVNPTAVAPVQPVEQIPAVVVKPPLAVHIEPALKIQPPSISASPPPPVIHHHHFDLHGSRGLPVLPVCLNHQTPSALFAAPNIYLNSYTMPLYSAGFAYRPTYAGNYNYYPGYGLGFSSWASIGLNLSRSLFWLLAIMAGGSNIGSVYANGPGPDLTAGNINYFQTYQDAVNGGMYADPNFDPNGPLGYANYPVLSDASPDNNAAPLPAISATDEMESKPSFVFDGEQLEQTDGTKQGQIVWNEPEQKQYPDPFLFAPYHFGLLAPVFAIQYQGFPQGAGHHWSVVGIAMAQQVMEAYGLIAQPQSLFVKR